MSFYRDDEKGFRYNYDEDEHSVRRVATVIYFVAGTVTAEIPSYELEKLLYKYVVINIEYDLYNILRKILQLHYSGGSAEDINKEVQNFITFIKKNYKK